MRDIIRRNKRIAIAISALILTIAGIIIKNNITGSASTGRPWERWAVGSDRFGYVSAYYPENDGVTYEDIMSYRSGLDSALTEASIEVKEGTRGYTDAFSLQGTADVNAAGDNNIFKVNVTAVGGDFFYMHPLELLSGNYIGEADLMEDRVVIDENTAWYLYGSSNIAGKYMMIGTTPYYIAGVVRAHDSGTSKKTYGTRTRIYMSYKGYNRINPESKITCYEVVYPDLVTNFAMKTLKKAIGLGDASSGENDPNQKEDKNIDVVNYCTRFGIPNIWSTLLSYGERSSHTDGIVYPYWENEYRMIEDYLVLWFVWTILCVTVIVVSVTGYIVAGCRYVHDVAIKVSERVVSTVKR